LVAELSFQIGTLLFEEGSRRLAKEQVARSCSISIHLANQLPIRFRARYLNAPSRRAAQALLWSLQNTQQLGPESEKGVRQGLTETKTFPHLYRISRIGSLGSLDGFLESLSSILRQLPYGKSIIFPPQERKVISGRGNAEISPDVRNDIEVLLAND